MSVYFAKIDRYIKIGFSENPERRVARLWQSGTRYGRPWDCPMAEPVLLLAINGDKPLEARCHEALSDYYATREWFIDEPGVRDFMAQAERGRFPVVVRPGGPFEPADWTAASKDRRAEMNRWISRRHGRPIDLFGRGNYADPADVVFGDLFTASTRSP